jgi:hypothetical protein
MMMPDPVGTVPPREFTPGLQLLVFDPDVEGNEQVDKVDATSPEAGARYAEAIDQALESDAWRTGGSGGDLTGYATEDYVEEQFQIIVDALAAVMNP